MLHICIVSENQSSNLGDIAIFDSLCHLLQERYTVTALNLSQAGHGFLTQINLPQKKDVSIIKLVLKRLVPIKFIAELRWYFGGVKSEYKKYVLEKLSCSDIVLIGGGQLLKENLSLFSNRLAVICRESNKRKIPYLFFGVGMDEKADKLFKLKMRQAFKNSLIAVFRDSASQVRANHLFNAQAKTYVCPDPCFSKGFYQQKKMESASIDIAINIMSIPSVLKASNRFFKLDYAESHVRDAFLRILNNFSSKGLRVSVFTTGSAEDCEELRLVTNMYQIAYGHSLHSFQPSSVYELSCYLLAVSKVLAIRMHAGIMAHSLLCNVVSVNWDPKVLGVWSLVNGEKRVVGIDDLISDSFPSTLEALFNVLGSPQDHDITVLRDIIRQSLFASLGRCVDIASEN